MVDARSRIFSRSRAIANTPGDVGGFMPSRDPRWPGRDDPAPLWNALDVQREADRVLLSRYTPVGVVVDESMTVFQFRGRTADYLEPAPGLASMDLFRMLREGLLAEVRAATAQAKAENVAVIRDGLQLTDQGTTRIVRIEVIPFKVPPSGIRFFLILFQEPAALERPSLGWLRRQFRPRRTTAHSRSSRRTSRCGNTCSRSSRCKKAPTKN